MARRRDPKKIQPKGSGIMNIPYLDRAADPQKGKMVYTNKCQRCHGADGQGTKKMMIAYMNTRRYGEKTVIIQQQVYIVFQDLQVM